mgnify:CR=1 FL=1
MSLKGAVRHFKTITHHRHEVIRNCRKAGIFWQGLGHDLSKYTWIEFRSGMKYYLGTRSPNEVEREIDGYSTAWLHHKGRNLHHFEYWNDYNPAERRVLPVRMPIKYVAEMFCDRVAASKVYQGRNYTNDHPLNYFMRGKPNRFIHPDTSDLTEYLLRMLANEGEDKTFACLRQIVKSGKYPDNIPKY